MIGAVYAEEFSFAAWFCQRGFCETEDFLSRYRGNNKARQSIEGEKVMRKKLWKSVILNSRWDLITTPTDY